MVDYTDTLNEFKILHLKYYYLFLYSVSFSKFSKKHIHIIKKEIFYKVKKNELKNENSNITFKKYFKMT